MSQAENQPPRLKIYLPPVIWGVSPPSGICPTEAIRGYPTRFPTGLMGDYAYLVECCSHIADVNMTREALKQQLVAVLLPQTHLASTNDLVGQQQHACTPIVVRTEAPMRHQLLEACAHGVELEMGLGAQRTVH